MIEFSHSSIDVESLVNDVTVQWTEAPRSDDDDAKLAVRYILAIFVETLNDFTQTSVKIIASSQTTD